MAMHELHQVGMGRLGRPPVVDLQEYMAIAWHQPRRPASAQVGGSKGIHGRPGAAVVDKHPLSMTDRRGQRPHRLAADVKTARRGVLAIETGQRLQAGDRQIAVQTN